jgi:hypothetical protein
MNKWFESKNIASYAKTALLQAQKTIDQVLDIKEEEILKAAAATTTSDLNRVEILAETTIEEETSFLNASLPNQLSNEENKVKHKLTTIGKKQHRSAPGLTKNLSTNSESSSLDSKQSWCQNYVNSSGGGNNNESSLLFISSSSSSSTSSTSTTNAPVVLLTSSVTSNSLNSTPTNILISSISDDKTLQEQLTLSSDYIKLEKPQQESQSGCGSSNDDEEGGEGLETCVSSDIEVLSLPASSSSTTTKTTMIANSNVMQIIKSQEEEEEEQDNNNNNTATAIMDIKHMQYVLEARESNILKLNQKNVQLQEANDNLLSELEKFKFEQTDKANSQHVVSDLTNGKYSQNEKEKSVI